MAFCFQDGLDSYASTADLTKKWPVAQSPWTWNATAGRTGGGGLVAATTGGSVLQTPAAIFPLTAQISLGGYHLKISAPPAANAALLEYVDYGNNQLGNLGITTAGNLYLSGSRGGGANVTGITNVCDGLWHWIDFWIGIKAGVQFQTYKMLLDGTLTEWNSAVFAAIIGSGNVSYARFVSIAGVTVTIDDPILYDDTGSGLTSGSWPLLPRQIKTNRPSSDASIQFTRSSGTTNFSNVNEVNPEATNHVQDSVAGDQDLYGYTSLGFSPANVTLAVLNSYLHNPVGGSINHRQVAKSGGITAYGPSTITPTNVPHMLQVPFYTDPAGGAWSGAAIDAAQFGIAVAP